MAAVSRALHSAGIVAGPKGGPGKQHILLNNGKCYVMAPDVVRKLMETLSAVAEYDREGNPYVGQMTLQSFRRQGLEQQSAVYRRPAGPEGHGQYGGQIRWQRVNPICPGQGCGH